MIYAFETVGEGDLPYAYGIRKTKTGIKRAAFRHLCRDRKCVGQINIINQTHEIIYYLIREAPWHDVILEELDPITGARLYRVYKKDM